MNIPATKIPAITEKQFQEQVVELAELLGWQCYHTFDSRRSAAGWPDLALWKPARFMLAELKTDKGKVSTAQRATIEGLRAAGVSCQVWRPRDWEAIVQSLKHWPPVWLGDFE